MPSRKPEFGGGAGIDPKGATAPVVRSTVTILPSVAKPTYAVVPSMARPSGFSPAMASNSATNAGFWPPMPPVPLDACVVVDDELVVAPDDELEVVPPVPELSPQAEPIERTSATT